MGKVKFSIVIPTRNRATTGLLLKAVQSIESQKPGSYSYEIVLVDDASTDKTEDLILSLIKKNKLIKYKKLIKNVGTPKAIREGISISAGDYIVVMGDDDKLPKNSLKDRAEFIELNPGIDWFYGKTQWIDENDEPIKTWTQSQEFTDHHYARMFLQNYIQGGTTTVKKSIYDNIVWPEWLTTRDDDFLAYELVRPGRYRFAFLDRVVFNYRCHDVDKRESQKNLNDAKANKDMEEVDKKIRSEVNDPELAFLADIVKERDAQIIRLVEEKKVLQQELSEREARLSRIYSSVFWKISFPLRKLIRIIRR